MKRELLALTWLIVCSSASAQMLIAPDGLGMTSSPDPLSTFPLGSTSTPSLAPPPVLLPPSNVPHTTSEWSTVPVPTVGTPILETPMPPHPMTSHSPAYEYAAPPATILPPVLQTPSLSTWQPVKPKHPRAGVMTPAATVETSIAPSPRPALRTPSAARVWRAAARFRN